MYVPIWCSWDLDWTGVVWQSKLYNSYLICLSFNNVAPWHATLFCSWSSKLKCNTHVKYWTKRSLKIISGFFQFQVKQTHFYLGLICLSLTLRFVRTQSLSVSKSGGPWAEPLVGSVTHDGRGSTTAARCPKYRLSFLLSVPCLKAHMIFITSNLHLLPKRPPCELALFREIKLEGLPFLLPHHHSCKWVN